MTDLPAPQAPTDPPAPPQQLEPDGRPDRGGCGPRRRSWLVCLGLAMAMAVLAALALQQELSGPSAHAPGRSAARSAADPAPTPLPAPTAAPAPLAASAPTRLRIPRINVDAPFTELSLDDSGTLVPPPADDQNLVGWYRGSVTPGENGTSVVVGHLDTVTGPAVFQALGTLRSGDLVDITRADGGSATFAVDAVRTFAKDHFPDQEVYADTPDPQLRLITCGGSYDRSRGGYTDNVVAFAHLLPQQAR